MTEFIVAEVSKNWIEGEDVPGPNEGLVLSEIFENVIEANRQRGYILYQFSVTHSFPAEKQLNETIIAVFRMKE